MDIPDEFLDRILTALDHYSAYLKATSRDDRPYLEAAEFLKKRKMPAKEEPAATVPKKKRA